MHKKLLNITTITFDGDNTLWDFRSVMKKSLKMTLKKIIKSIPSAKKLTVDYLIKFRDQIASESRFKGKTHEEIRYESFRRVLYQYNCEDTQTVNNIYNYYMKQRFSDILLYNDALKVLDYFHRKYKTGLISNGNTYPDKFDLAGYFDFIILSQQYGCKKPDKKIFEIAMEQSNTQGSNMLHVGDSLEEDVAGAGNCRIMTVWVNRDKMMNRTEIKPDYVIYELKELFLLLD